MKLTQLEQLQYITKARAAGQECGRFVATLKDAPGRNRVTIERASYGYVNRLPLNDLQFETRLTQEFQAAAMQYLSTP